MFNFLQDLTDSLSSLGTDILGLETEPVHEIDPQLTFLLHLLETTEAHADDPRLLRRFLRAHDHHLDSHFPRLLHRWGQQTLASADPLLTQDLCNTLVVLGDLFSTYESDHPQIDQALMRISYELALVGIQQERTTQLWSRLHRQLGLYYFYQSPGPRSENQDLGIRHLNQALTALSQDRHGSDWATTHHALAKAYRDLQAGDRR